MSEPILVVEDEVALRAVLRFHLQLEEFNVVLATNGREAWEALEREPFRAVVSDHFMPEMTGLELCAQIRKDRRFRALPVILLTGHLAEPDAERMCNEAGVTRLVFKPFSPRALLATVKACLDSPAANGESKA